MNRTRKSFLLALIAFTGTASAEGYIGFKGGIMQLDGASDDAVNIGLYGGSNKDAGISFEGELTLSAVDGTYSSFIGDIDVSLTTLAGYAAFRSAGETYFKAKVGALYEDVEASAGSASASDSDTGVSGGFGVGFKSASGSSFEIEYTVIEEDADFISFGVLF